MYYRTIVNGEQIFAKNEYYSEWIDFIKANGIDVDSEGCYDGEIDDVQGMFEVIDKITRKIIEDRHKKVMKGENDRKGRPLKELTDLSGSIWFNKETPILMFNRQTIEMSYCFLPYRVYLAVKSKIEKVNEVYGENEKDGVKWALSTYKIKDGEKIRVNAIKS